MVQGLIRGRRRWLLAASVVLVTASCGGTAAQRSSPSPPGPSATASTPAPAQGFQVLVAPTVRPAGVTVDLYDSTAGGFRTVPAAGSQARFAGAGRLSFLTPDGIVSQNLDGSGRRTELSGSVIDYAWSRDGALAYITSVGAHNDQFQLAIKLPSGQTSTADVGRSGGIGGMVPQRKLEFSPDGQLLLVAEPMISDPYIQVRGLDASLRFAPPVGTFVSGGGADWTTGGRLAVSNAGSLQMADPATGEVRTLLSGVHAWDPAASSDGRYIVYEQRDPQSDRFGGYGPPRLQAFDTTAGKVVDGFHRDDGSLPRFVSPVEFWFSVGSDSAPPIYRYDLSGRTENPAGVSGFIADVRIGAGGS